MGKGRGSRKPQNALTFVIQSGLSEISFSEATDALSRVFLHDLASSATSVPEISAEQFCRP